MTRDEIMNMQAGRELDALVAEHIFGWHFDIDPERPQDKIWMDTDGTYMCSEEMYHYHFSQDIQAAWQVVERLRDTDPFNAGARFAETIAEMTDANQDDYMLDAFNMIFGINPLAICRAALLTCARC